MSEDVPQLLLEYATSSTDDLFLRAVMSAIDIKKPNDNVLVYDTNGEFGYDISGYDDQVSARSNA
ncbi:hypothetical protein F441_22650 [Phytophthora nicotianae CJ01A1]|uniref:Uncharacterized protein n=2 Tax=Phytophthora nicotianae TaxID=4792 RepID=W2VP19_PHYNI|nr:hypothetical protein F444_22617 [Phytophthora nicotianae P1976]ETO99925.1 hypothetical protein F441_22650 [Phytophthora nicotianae CJ01A1]